MMIRRPLRLAAVVPGARAATVVTSGGSPPTATGVAHTRNSAMTMQSMPGQRRRVSHTARVLIGLLLVVVSLPASRLLTPVGAAAASPIVTLTPNNGPPTTMTTVKGTGFGARETIDVYFDTTDRVLASTTATGGFSINLTVPATATPVTHWITANARKTRLSAQAPFAVSTSWQSFRDGPGHSGANPYENVLNPSTVGGLNEQWATATGNIVLSSPAYQGGYLYVGSWDDNVYKLNAATGAVVWTYTTGSDVFSSPTVTGGVVYVGSSDGSVYALNATTGAKLWATATGLNIESSPTVVNGVVYVGSENDNVYALNASTGAIEWLYTTGGPITESSPAVVNGVVYIGSTDGNVYALNASTGLLKWATLTGGSFESSPAVVNGVVYIGNDDAGVYALNAATGLIKWAYGTGGAVASSPAVFNGTVYVGSGDDNVYALNAATGSEEWTAETGGAVVSAPAVANGVVYVGSDDASIYALNAGNGASPLGWDHRRRYRILAGGGQRGGLRRLRRRQHLCV